MTIYNINGRKIKDWKSFHREFKKELNFPDYYGENMNAWIDCVDELTEKPTLINIKNGKVLKENSPEIFEAILECSAFVNHRKLDIGEKQNLIISTES
jgi:RNAse (barnase) inhibitor barstar